METHARKRMEIWIEAPLLKRVEEVLEKAKTPVYAVFDGREGKGLSGSWSDAGVMDAHDMRLLVAVTTEDVVERVCAELAGLFKRYPGVIVLSDVQVMRADRC